MMSTAYLILLSGAVCAGKTSIASLLENSHHFNRISTSGHLKAIAMQRDLAVNRVTMQDLGDQQDVETDFAWPVTVSLAQMAATPGTRWLLDAVRKRRQIHHFRARIPGVILHVHLWAPESVLRARYEARQAAGEEYGDDGLYNDFVGRPNEVESRSLIDVADLSFDTNLVSSAVATQQILARLFGGVACDKLS